MDTSLELYFLTADLEEPKLELILWDTGENICVGGLRDLFEAQPETHVPVLGFSINAPSSLDIVNYWVSRHDRDMFSVTNEIS